MTSSPHPAVQTFKILLLQLAAALLTIHFGERVREFSFSLLCKLEESGTSPAPMVGILAHHFQGVFITVFVLGRVAPLVVGLRGRRRDDRWTYALWRQTRLAIAEVVLGVFLVAWSTSDALLIWIKPGGGLFR